MRETMIRRIAQAICKSRTCRGIDCCLHPANARKRGSCFADTGGYDDAARAAVDAYNEYMLDSLPKAAEQR